MYAGSCQKRKIAKSGECQFSSITVVMVGTMAYKFLSLKRT